MSYLNKPFNKYTIFELYEGWKFNYYLDLICEDPNWGVVLMTIKEDKIIWDLTTGVYDSTETPIPKNFREFEKFCKKFNVTLVKK